MKHFKRVAETTGMPDYVERTFFPSNSGLREDPFAELKETRAQRRAQLSQASGSVRRVEDTQHQPKTWEKMSSAQLYERPNSFFDEEYDSEDYSSRTANLEGTVRRVQDTGTYGRDMVAPPDFKWCEMADTMSVLQAQSAGYNSIWGEVDESIRDGFMSFAENDNANFEKKASAQRREAVNAEWENNQRNRILRESRIVESRTNPLIRNGLNRVAAEEPSRGSKFGMMDWDAVLAKESERRAMAEDRRDRKMSIKAVDRHQVGVGGQDLEWEDDMSNYNHARSTRDGYEPNYHRSDWTSRLSGYGRR